MIPLEAALKFAKLTGIEVPLDPILSLGSNKPVFDMFALEDKLKKKYPEYSDYTEKSLCEIINELWPEEGERLARCMFNIENVI